MKRNIIFASALALCMGLSFTSCLDSNNDSDTSYVGGFVKVTSNYMGLGSFKGPDGKTTINPSNASLTNLEQNGFKMSNVNAAFIQGTYNKEENLDVETSQTFQNVSITYAVALDAPVEIVSEAGARNDSVNMACIRSLDNTGNGSNNYFSDDYNKPWFFYDETTLVLPISYYLSGQKLHDFTLVFNSSECKQGDTTLKLSLRHYNAKENSNQYDSYSFASNYPYAYFFAFDLTNAIYAWKSTTYSTDEPERITIEYVASDYSNDLAHGQTKLLTIERKALVQ